MRSTRTRLAAVAATTAALALAAPVGSAGAQVPGDVVPVEGLPGGCPSTISPSGIGDAGATQSQVCGAALSFVGPSVGQVATVIGPTIIGGVVNAPVMVSAGSVGAVAVP
jgi:hypothetical protein